ncbi:AMP-binding protein [Nocardia sp. R6R-6]|uniref:AMP-binding protein n=1 Tax=Nocardia sp. R6R-6 TaxID=3459303 RepID=UPI00403DEADB
MTAQDHTPDNILAIQVAHWAATRPDAPAYTELRYHMHEQVPITVTYAGLHTAAAALAARLRRESAPGDRIAILCAHGIDYAVAFLACLYSNRPAVPLFPASGTRNRERLQAILADARPTLTLLSAHDEITPASIGPALGRVLIVPPEASASMAVSAADPTASTTRPAPATTQPALITERATRREHSDEPEPQSVEPAASTSASRPDQTGQPTGPDAGTTAPRTHSATPATYSAALSPTSVTEWAEPGPHGTRQTPPAMVPLSPKTPAEGPSSGPAAHPITTNGDLAAPTIVPLSPPTPRRDAAAQRARRGMRSADSASRHGEATGGRHASARIVPATDADSLVVEPVRSELAYLQYTSGSTKSPAGVRVTHQNLAAAVAQLRDALCASEDRPIVTWLPLFHDMGLILGLALPLALGVHGVTLAAAEFVKRPIRWLRALSDYGAGITGCPNFALTLAVSGTTPQERAGLDLSTLDVLLNGAEPVRAGALYEFTRTFSPHGFRHRAHTPGFGLAEATLAVTVCDPGAEPVWHHFDRAALAEGRAVALPAGTRESHNGVALVGCGGPAGQEVCVVDPTTGMTLPAGRVGEIWVAGNNVGDGYFGRPDATEETFGATLAHADIRWLRTGDLGFQHEGQLYIAGRRKDVIVVDGRNHYPTDIETTVAACSPKIRPGHVTAFGHDDGLREDLVVIAELVTIAAAEPAELFALARRIRTVIASTHDVMPGTVLLVERGRIPKTSSGKLRRGECRARYLAGQLRPVAMI